MDRDRKAPEPSQPAQPPRRGATRDRAEPPSMAEWRAERDARHARRAELLADAERLEQRAAHIRAGAAGDAGAEQAAEALESSARRIRHDLDFNAAARPVTPKARRPACGARAKSKGRPCRVRAEWDEERDEPTTRRGRCRFHGGTWRKGLETRKLREPSREAAPSEATLPDPALLAEAGQTSAD